MVFNEIASPRSGIIQMQEKTAELGLGTISGNAAPDYYLDLFTGKTNEWLHVVTQWIQQVSDEWNFDDSNNTGFQIESYSAVNDQQDYGLDTDIAKIRKIEVRDATSLEYSTLDYIYEKDRAEDRFGKDSDSPSGYWFSGRSLVFNVPVDSAKTDKYQITYDRHSSVFAISDTTKVPGFDKTFHWLLVYGPVMDFTFRRKPEISAMCRDKIFGAGENDPRALKTMLEDFYINQNKNATNSIGRKFKTYG